MKTKFPIHPRSLNKTFCSLKSLGILTQKASMITMNLAVYLYSWEKQAGNIPFTPAKDIVVPHKFTRLNLE